MYFNEFPLLLENLATTAGAILLAGSMYKIVLIALLPDLLNCWMLSNWNRAFHCLLIKVVRLLILLSPELMRILHQILLHVILFYLIVTLPKCCNNRKPLSVMKPQYRGVTYKFPQNRTKNNPKPHHRKPLRPPRDGNWKVDGDHLINYWPRTLCHAIQCCERAYFWFKEDLLLYFDWRTKVWS